MNCSCCPVGRERGGNDPRQAARRRGAALRRTRHRQRLDRRDRPCGRAAQLVRPPLPLRQPRRGRWSRCSNGTFPISGAAGSSSSTRRGCVPPTTPVRPRRRSSGRSRSSRSKAGKNAPTSRYGSALGQQVERLPAEVQALLHETSGYEAWDLLRARCPRLAKKIWLERMTICIAFIGRAAADRARTARPGRRASGALRRPVRRQSRRHGGGRDDGAGDRAISRSLTRMREAAMHGS